MSSNEFVTKNVDEILNNKEMEYSKSLAMATTWILGNFKGVNLKIIDMQKTTSLSDYFVVASATNTSMANAMVNEICSQMRRLDKKIFSREGVSQNSEWMLIDLGDIIVHIFDENARGAYGVDSLWDAPTLEIPNDYYTSEEEAESANDKGYF